MAFLTISRLRYALGSSTFRRSLVKGGLGSILVKLISTLAGFLLAVVLARTLGADGYGVYAFALSLIMLIAIPAQVGLPKLVLRETAKADVLEDWHLMRGLWRWANAYVALCSILMITLGLFGLWIGEHWLGAEQLTAMAVGLVLIPLIALGNVRGAALCGLQRVVLGQLPEAVLRPVFTLFLMLGVMWAWPPYSEAPVVAMSVHAVAALLAFSFGAVMLRLSSPLGLRKKPSAIYRPRYWRRAAMPLAMLAGLQVIIAHTDIVMLGALRENQEVGVYRVVIQVATLVAFGLQAANQLLQPYFARLYAQGNLVQLQRLVTASARIILLLALPPALLLFFWGQPLLILLFGGPYAVGATAMTIIVAGQLTNAAFGSVGILLNMTGHERDTVRGVAIAAITNIILNALLIPYFGMNGAAFATAITLLIWNLILWLYVRKRLAIESTAIGLRINYAD